MSGRSALPGGALGGGRGCAVPVALRLANPVRWHRCDVPRGPSRPARHVRRRRAPRRVGRRRPVARRTRGGCRWSRRLSRGWRGAGVSARRWPGCGCGRRCGARQFGARAGQTFRQRRGGAVPRRVGTRPARGLALGRNGVRPTAAQVVGGLLPVCRVARLHRALDSRAPHPVAPPGVAGVALVRQRFPLPGGLLYPRRVAPPIGAGSPVAHRAPPTVRGASTPG